MGFRRAAAGRCVPPARLASPSRDAGATPPHRRLQPSHGRSTPGSAGRAQDAVARLVESSARRRAPGVVLTMRRPVDHHRGQTALRGSRGTDHLRVDGGRTALLGGSPSVIRRPSPNNQNSAPGHRSRDSRRRSPAPRPVSKNRIAVERRGTGRRLCRSRRTCLGRTAVHPGREGAGRGRGARQQVRRADAGTTGRQRAGGHDQCQFTLAAYTGANLIQNRRADIQSHPRQRTTVSGAAHLSC